MSLVAGRVVVVTGASSGIGRVVAATLSARGARVVAAARSAGPLEELQREAGENLLPVVADVGDPEAVEELARRTIEACGEVDAVVNNAGVGHLESFPVSSPDHWRETLTTNLIGPLLVARAFLPAMLEAGRGVILNVGSSGASGWPFLALYSASKAGLRAATASIDREIGERGVRVTSVEIGSTAGTGFGSDFDPATVEAATRAWTRCGIPWDQAIATPQQSAAKIIEALERALAGGGGDC